MQAVEAQPLEIASQDGKVRIPAYWFESAGKQPRPVVIGLHGCGGALGSKGKLAYRMARHADLFCSVQSRQRYLYRTSAPRFRG